LQADVVGAETDSDVTADRTVFGLITNVGRDVTAARNASLLVVRLFALLLYGPQVMEPLVP